MTKVIIPCSDSVLSLVDFGSGRRHPRAVLLYLPSVPPPTSRAQACSDYQLSDRIQKKKEPGWVYVRQNGQK
jgi:hypothetical protein